MSNYCYFCRIDATKSVNLAKFVNDLPEQYRNCFMRKIVVEKIPRLILVAKKLIKSGTELRYNYGDTKISIGAQKFVFLSIYSIVFVKR